MLVSRWVAGQLTVTLWTGQLTVVVWTGQLTVVVWTGQLTVVVDWTANGVHACVIKVIYQRENVNTDHS